MADRTPLGEITTLNLAQPHSQSLRTTVPSGVVKQLGLREGDQLDWSIEAKDGRLVLIVSPKKKSR